MMQIHAWLKSRIASIANFLPHCLIGQKLHKPLNPLCLFAAAARTAVRPVRQSVDRRRPERDWQLATRSVGWGAVLDEAKNNCAGIVAPVAGTSGAASGVKLAAPTPLLTLPRRGQVKISHRIRLGEPPAL